MSETIKQKQIDRSDNRIKSLALACLDNYYFDYFDV